MRRPAGAWPRKRVWRNWSSGSSHRGESLHESGEPQLHSKRFVWARFPSPTAPDRLQGPCTRSPLWTRTMFWLGRPGRYVNQGRSAMFADFVRIVPGLQQADHLVEVVVVDRMVKGVICRLLCRAATTSISAQGFPNENDRESISSSSFWDSGTAVGLICSSICQESTNPGDGSPPDPLARLLARSMATPESQPSSFACRDQTVRW